MRHRENTHTLDRKVLLSSLYQSVRTSCLRLCSLNWVSCRTAFPQAELCLLPTIVGTFRYSPFGSASWIEVLVKSPSIACPVDFPTFSRNTSTGKFRIHCNFAEAEALARKAQLVLVISESKVAWNAGVSGPVSGKAPPLCRIAPRKRLSSRPPYAIMWEYVETAPALQNAQHQNI